jgi:hypothetical protein
MLKYIFNIISIFLLMSCHEKKAINYLLIKGFDGDIYIFPVKHLSEKLDSFYFEKNAYPGVILSRTQYKIDAGCNPIYSQNFYHYPEIYGNRDSLFVAYFVKCSSKDFDIKYNSQKELSKLKLGIFSKDYLLPIMKYKVDSFITFYCDSIGRGN